MLLSGRGFFSAYSRPMFHMITRSWHMYPLGLLLGWDRHPNRNWAAWNLSGEPQRAVVLAILVFPMLFAAGMSLIDTTDNVLMLRRIWMAFVKPIRKLYYNITITCVSVSG